MLKACTLANAQTEAASQAEAQSHRDPGYWAKAPFSREDTPVFAPSLDAMIPADHIVRLLEEIFDALDWSPWEQRYIRTHGQPPIHPRVLAGVLLYGLLRRVRSSRMLEYLCNHCLDFMWLTEGRAIDHSTLCKFRVRFRSELKDLFRQVCHLARNIGLIRLGQIMFDGTREKANNARNQTATAKSLERRIQSLEELEAEFEKMLAAMEEGDLKDEQIFATGQTATQLPDELADAKARRKKLQEALQKAQAQDEARRKDGLDPQKHPSQVCLTDPDATVMPNKEGGYAPNYTPTVAVDADSGFIVDATVLADVNEYTEMTPAIDRITEMFGQAPESVVADPGNATGPNHSQMEDRQVAFYTPTESSQPQPGEAAFREDPTQPVEPQQRDEMPRNNQGQIDKSAFVYDQQQDVYICPMGETLGPSNTKTRDTKQGKVKLTVYQCSACQGCPLAGACVSPKAKHGRTITRDEHEEARERTAARMATPEGKKIYARRLHVGETPFAVIKAVMHLRQFLLRGLERVRTEWLWACTAYNLRKLMNSMEILRAYVVARAA